MNYIDLLQWGLSLIETLTLQSSIQGQNFRLCNQISVAQKSIIIQDINFRKQNICQELTSRLGIQQCQRQGLVFCPFMTGLGCVTPTNLKWFYVQCTYYILTVCLRGGQSWCGGWSGDDRAGSDTACSGGRCRGSLDWTVSTASSPCTRCRHTHNLKKGDLTNKH